MQQYELNLRDYARIFQKRKFTVIAVFCIVLGVSFFNISQQPYIYEATATVKVEQGKTIAGLLTEWIVYNPQDVMQSETKLVRGYPVMEKVARQMGLVSDKMTPEEVRSMIAGLQGRVAASKVQDTNIIEISARGQEPREVMDLVNAVARTYVEQNLEEKNRQATHARKFIADQLASIEGRLADDEQKLRSFGGKASQLRIADPVQSKISELQMQLTELSQKYTEQHPKIIQMREQVRSLEDQLVGFSSEEIEYNRILREIEINKKLYGTLKEKLEEARIAEAQKVSDISIVDPAVLPTHPVEPNKEMGLLVGAILGLVIGVAFAFFFETIDPSIGTIEDVENVIKLQVLGVVPSIRAEIEGADDSVFAHIKQYFKRPSAHRTEKEREMDRYIRLFVHHKPNSLVAEAFRNIQANLKINPEGNKVFLMTSSGPGEGKTTSLINLGLISAQSGLKTLLVSTDLRRPTIAKAFGLKREFGLREYLEGILNYNDIVKSVSDMALGEMAFDEILKFQGIENVSVISSGDIPSNPAAILSSQRLAELIKQARRDFDLIVFDSPPVLPIADASLIAPLVDSVILVYEIGKTARQALMRAKMQIESTGARIAGVILNNIKPRTESIMFSYPYYYKYKYADEKESSEGRGSSKGLKA